MKEALIAAGCLISLLALWVTPIILGIKAADTNHRSPHWMWFGVHPLGGWIAFLILRFSPPLKPCPVCGGRVKASVRFCSNCAAPITGGLPGYDLTTPAAKTIQIPWKWVTIICGVFALGIAGFVVLVLGIVEMSFKGSTPYQEALRRAQSDSRAIEVLGSPIVDGKFASGSMNTVGDASGQADLSIPVHGPRGHGQLYVSATLRAGTWSYDVMEIAAENQSERINLLRKHQTLP